MCPHNKNNLYVAEKLCTRNTRFKVCCFKVAFTAFPFKSKHSTKYVNPPAAKLLVRIIACILDIPYECGCGCVCVCTLPQMQLVLVGLWYGSQTVQVTQQLDSVVWLDVVHPVAEHLQ